MSINFDANQYNSAYKPTFVRNWQTGYGALRKDSGAHRPGDIHAPTVPFCDINGHFTDKKYRGETASAYTGFVGTWDMPRRVDVHPRMLNSTARSAEHAETLRQTFERDKKIVVPDMERRICWLKQMKACRPLPDTQRAYRICRNDPLANESGSQRCLLRKARWLP